MEPENDALAAVLHAVRRGGVGASRKVARHYRDEAELGLERSIQRDFNNVGQGHFINADNGARRGHGAYLHIKHSLVKSQALLVLRRDPRSRCFQGCAYLIAGRSNDAIATLQGVSSSTRDSDLASAIDLTLASAFRKVGSLNDWLEAHLRCAARQQSSLRIVGRVFATFAALRIGDQSAALKLLNASYEATPEELRSAHSELSSFVAAASCENPGAARDLMSSLRRLDLRGLWAELLEDATKKS